MIKNSTYETVEGTEPTPDAPHEPRTVVRTDEDAIYMMTEIEDGVFVQWGTCHSCHDRVSVCSCKEGPTMAPFMQKWRDQRFEKSLRHRMKERLEDMAPQPEKKPYNPEESYFEPAPEDTGEKVDAGLDSALEAVKARVKEEQTDVGF